MSEQVACGVANAVGELHLPGLYTRHHSRSQGQLEHAAHQETLIGAVRELASCGCVENKHTEPPAMATLQNGKWVNGGEKR